MAPFDFQKNMIDGLDEALRDPMRWAGAIAKRMRHFNIALTGKTSGSSNTDALTLADLIVQELLVGAIRDGSVHSNLLRIEAEEETGDLAHFAKEGELTITIDPIDGTKQYRDKTGNGYAVMVTLRRVQTVLLSLVFIPESGPNGTWVHVSDGIVKCGPDNPRERACDVVNNLSVCKPHTPAKSKKIYLIGFQKHDRAKAELVTQAGLEGVAADDCQGCLYELLATGEYAGSLIHSPNVYDYPVSLHIARSFGGDSVWVHNGQPVHFQDLWMDERANMLRLPGIVATSPDANVRKILCDLAKDWNPVRYAE